ncbi:hypothetical protein COE50_06355 [Bacillus anthracis]|nr:hypothetical protein COE50_06355 [Bacillus anthracis]
MIKYESIIFKVIKKFFVYKESSRFFLSKRLLKRNIFMVMGYRRFGKRNKEVPKSKFKYIKEANVFACSLCKD